MSVAGLGDIYGNGPSSELIKRLIHAQRLPHSLLLEGQPGCGRRTIARAAAKALLCSNRQNGDACNRCESCALVDQSAHPDLMQLPHDTELAELPVDMIRDEVVYAAQESPLMGQGRVFIIPSVERLMRNQRKGANALLKVLEEPPAGTTFIMTTALGGGLLDTIRTRSQRFRLAPLSREDVERVLRRQGMDAPTASRRAAIAQGSHRSGSDEVLIDAPIDEFCALVGEGYDAHAIADLMQRVEYAAAQLPKAATPTANVKRVLDAWLHACLDRLRRGLRGENGDRVIQQIRRVLRCRGDIALNLRPRLVIEALSLPL